MGDDEHLGSTTNFELLTSKTEVLKKYLIHLNKIKQYAQLNNISEIEFNDYMLKRHFNNNTNNDNYVFYKNTSKVILKTVLERRKKILNFVFILLTLFTLFVYKHEASSIVLRNIQTYIYPGMKMWRKLTVPIISNYPILTELYDESCLVSNPYFQVDDLNCEPCASVTNVLDFSYIDEIPNSNAPYIFKTLTEQTDIEMFYNLYKGNENIFKQDAFKVQSTNKNIRNLEDLFDNFINKSIVSKSHNIWRCNRMLPARLLRKLFPRLDKHPATGINLERYLSIDSPMADPYPIPDAECSHMFIIQGYGTRQILLRPTQECRHLCRTLSVRLTANYALIYNWWYWKPISMPDQYSTSSSISYIGSYC